MALQLIAKLVLLHGLIEREALIAVALVPFAARIGPLAWSRALPDLHAGLGSRFRNAVRPADFALWTMLLLAPAWASPSLLAAPLVFLLWGWWLLARHDRKGVTWGKRVSARVVLGGRRLFKKKKSTRITKHI